MKAGMFANKSILVLLQNRNEFSVKYHVHSHCGNLCPGAPLVLSESLVFNYAEGLQNQLLAVSFKNTFYFFMEFK